MYVWYFVFNTIVYMFVFAFYTGFDIIISVVYRMLGTCAITIL